MEISNTIKMYKLIQQYTSLTFLLQFQDRQLAENFSRVFHCKDADCFQDRYDICIEIFGEEDGKYYVFCNEEKRACKAKRAGVIHEIAQIYCEYFCECLKDNIYLLHAAGVCSDDQYVCFFGPSGSGKTSLSIAYALQFGCYLGDEYTFLDITDGMAWYEMHPLQIKAENNRLMSIFQNAEKVYSCSNNTDVKPSYYISLREIPNMKTSPKRPVKLKTMIYPHYDPDQKCTKIQKMNIDRLPEAILSSMAGNRSPADIFRKFIKLASRNKIDFLEIWFSDSFEAAKDLKSHSYMKNVLIHPE